MNPGVSHKLIIGMSYASQSWMNREALSDESESNCIFAKTNDICFELNVDLKDFYMGKKKKLNVKRKVMVEVNGKPPNDKSPLPVPLVKVMRPTAVTKLPTLV